MYFLTSSASMLVGNAELWSSLSHEHGTFIHDRVALFSHRPPNDPPVTKILQWRNLKHTSTLQMTA